MNKITGLAINTLRKAAGERLAARREELGYKTRHQAWSKMYSLGVNVSYYRYKKLEKGYLPKNEIELFGVSRFFEIDLDCWLEGFCNNIKIEGCERMSELTPEMQKLIKGTFNDFVDRVQAMENGITI
ncbi:hypothetical protein AB835_12420 [Candidatus Endobugula sertula]|uniref:HTH cro/C1-type domain-containing protein n=1 Tax=Candidatus Endobugula sertula TaxID=62101 RepID=A0A1D2QMH2_9GAMM|nr:hypothetical protein AB835_12420 [Candidatus Endobugula sertula]